ncbi:carboxypeptidase-like regulatory domain-containing protein [Mariniblastus fucicola]|uniref:Cna protein B-type domain protein n=1 Tax=Mariniblastus fucicola TaxID=980251 RepID=A0A5B9P2G9_9BACT|nr:carboxypeptidase-like regulatory domain-containing protein [Mariniblastus fucicola]QEG20538.1 hypothetical protein MFFC18_03870 [Mariniblastus fucicola]
MTLNFLRRIMLALLLTSMLATIFTGEAFAQLPFGNLTPTEDTEEGAELGAGPVDQEGPMRPIDRRPATRPSDRPLDDELGEDDEPVQSVEVKERFAGWRGAGDIDGDRLSDTLRSNWVMLDRNGQFSGTVRGIDGAEVAGMTIFLMNNGRLVKTAAVQDDGTFVFTNVQRGAYSFVGWGDKAFFAFGANIINENPDADPSTPRTVNCYAFQNETTINTDWIRYFAPNIAYRVYGRYTVEEGVEDPDNLYGFDGLTENPVMAEPATSISGTPVVLDSRGRLTGRVHQMNSLSGRPVDLRTTKVMLLKGDDVIGSTTTDNFGIFQFTGVQPGGYGLVAVGVDGVGSVGIQVADDSDDVMDAEGVVGGGSGSPFDFTMVSAETVGWLNHYASDVAYRQAILKPRMKMPTGPTYQDPVCPTCLGVMGPGGCPKCGGNQEKAICRSPCVTYGQWVANGCACEPKTPALRRIGDRLREEVEVLDDRFEEAFYGAGNTGGGDYSNGYNQNPAGYAPTPAGYGGGTVPPVVQPNAAPVMPMARGQQQQQIR